MINFKLTLNLDLCGLSVCFPPHSMYLFTVSSGYGITTVCVNTVVKTTGLDALTIDSFLMQTSYFVREKKQYLESVLKYLVHILCLQNQGLVLEYPVRFFGHS